MDTKREIPDLKWRKGKHRIAMASDKSKLRSGIQTARWGIRKTSRGYIITQRGTGYSVGEPYQKLQTAKRVAAWFDRIPEIANANEPDSLTKELKMVGRAILEAFRKAEVEDIAP